MTPNWKYILGGAAVGAAVLYYVYKKNEHHPDTSDIDLRPEYKGEWMEQDSSVVLSRITSGTFLLAPIHTGIDRVQAWLRAQRLPELPAAFVQLGAVGRYVADPATKPVTYILFQKVGATTFYIVANTLGNVATQDAPELAGEISRAYFDTRNYWFRLDATKVG